MEEVIKKLMATCGYFDYGMDKLSLLEMAINKDSTFTLEIIKDSLIRALKLETFQWVNLAIESKFVYTSNEYPSKDFSVDELLIFTDSFRWKSILQQDAILSLEQKDDLKEQFREIGVQYYKNIYELLDNEMFEWLPFEVRHSYLKNFGEMKYSSEDIIYHLKSILWDYLFPNDLDLNRLNSLQLECQNILWSKKEKNDWIEMDSIVSELSSCYSGLDLYELSRAAWKKEIQHKKWLSF